MTGADRVGPLPLEPTVPPSSFSALLDAYGVAPRWQLPAGAEPFPIPVTEGTTILALRYADGVVMIGDRQATEGTTVAHRRVQKVYDADGFSAVAISGVAGIAIELIRLFKTELEHYEKLEGSRLSLEGKASFLSSMVRNQLPMAFQGLVVIPLFCGYEEGDGSGHLYSFDVVGGRYEEEDYMATGSGGSEALSFLRARYEPDLAERPALLLALQALIAAAEEDVATAGPDLRREIYPTVATVSGTGYREVPPETVAELSAEALESMT